ncbi:hypothetical protein DBR42_10525 [Pelomonas sp. HMWF004]|nr:hypothetical protein DBR42_10525 [Pelomonas sp. HMWF004]
MGQRKMLMSVRLPTGQVLLSDAQQRLNLQLAGAEPGKSPPLLAFVFSAVFVLMYGFLSFLIVMPERSK